MAEAFAQAEQEHLLDCPKAPFRARTAAFILDLFFLVLAVNGIDGLCQTIYLQLAQAPEAGTPIAGPAFWAGYLNLCLRAIS